MTKRRIRSQLLAYGLAVAAVAAAVALNTLLPELEGSAAVLFLAAVAFSAFYGGLWPGMLATVLSTLALDYFFVTEIRAIDLGPAVYMSLAVFVVVAVAINSLNVMQRRLQAALRGHNRRQSQFMAVLAHELRNFLSPITPAVAILKRRGQGDELVAETCATLERQVRNIARLIDDLLDVGRIEEGKVRLRVETVDLAAVVAEAVEAARPLIEARGHRLRLSLPPAPLRLAADRTRLEQVLVNLLTNAAKYTEPGGRIVLAVERDGRDVVVRVRDNGQGIDPRLLPRIFDPFTQAENGSQGGLGIGLNLVRGLVEMHGGRVAALSDGRGRGSEFVVRLPAPAKRTVQDSELQAQKL
jgi:signal transduction histidine kinase